MPEIQAELCKACEHNLVTACVSGDIDLEVNSSLRNSARRKCRHKKRLSFMDHVALRHNSGAAVRML